MNDISSRGIFESMKKKMRNQIFHIHSFILDNHTSNNIKPFCGNSRSEMKFSEIGMPRSILRNNLYLFLENTRFLYTRGIRVSSMRLDTLRINNLSKTRHAGGYTNDGSESCTDRVRGEENNQAKGVTYIFAERRKAGCGTVHRDAREASSTLCGYTARKGGRIPIARYFQSGL